MYSLNLEGVSTSRARRSCSVCCRFFSSICVNVSLACNTTPEPSKACFREHGEAVFNKTDRVSATGQNASVWFPANNAQQSCHIFTPLNSSCILPGLLNNSTKVDCDPCDRNKTESDATYVMNKPCAKNILQSFYLSFYPIITYTC